MIPCSKGSWPHSAGRYSFWCACFRLLPAHSCVACHLADSPPEGYHGRQRGPAPAHWVVPATVAEWQADSAARGAFFARKMKRIFGYVAEIQLSEGHGADTPAQIPIVTRGLGVLAPIRARNNAAGSWCARKPLFPKLFLDQLIGLSGRPLSAPHFNFDRARVHPSVLNWEAAWWGSANQVVVMIRSASWSVGTPVSRIFGKLLRLIRCQLRLTSIATLSTSFRN